MNENFKKRPSSQNTFFLSSGILDDLDNYLSDPQNRASKILSLKSIPHPKELPSNLETTNATPYLEEIEDTEALLNFINIEETRKKNDVDEIFKCEIKLEIESSLNTYEMFPKLKENGKTRGDETFKVEDSTQILQKFRRKTMFDLKNNLIEKIKKIPRDFNFEAHGRRFLFVKNSCFIFSEDNKVREFIVWVITSSWMKLLTFLICILNLITFIFYDYEYRIDRSLYFVTNFIFRDYVEILCYSYYTLEVLLKIIATGFIFGQNTYMRDGWHIFFLITLIASWSIYIPNNTEQKLCLCIRILGTVRLLVLFRPIKKNLTNIVKALVSVSNYFISVFGLMLFYAVVGLYLFYGLEENRCRETPIPEHGEWVAIESIESFCGSWKCNLGFCGNPADYGMERNTTENETRELNYGVTNFNNIFASLWNVFQFMDVMGWTGINYPFARASNGIVATIYFSTLLICGGLIFMNFLLATLFSNFVYHSSIKDSLKNEILKKHRKNKDDNGKVELKMLTSIRLLKKETYKKTSLLLIENIFNFMAYENALKAMIIKRKTTNNYFLHLRMRFAEIFHFNKYWLAFLHSVIIVNVIILSMDRYPISEKELNLLNKIDFAIFFFYFAEIILKVIAYGPNIYFQSPFNLIDFTIILLNAVSEVYVKFNDFQGIMVIRNLKVLRIFRTIYYSGIYNSFSILIKGLVFALTKLRYIIIIIILLIMIVSLIGKEIFAYKIRLKGPEGIESAPNMKTGISPFTNYDTFGNAFQGVLLIMYNEEWHLPLFQHYLKLGYNAYIFYVVIIICGQICCMTLFSALFLDYFVKFTQKSFMKKNFTPIGASYLIQELRNFINRIISYFELKRRKKSPSIAKSVMFPQDDRRKGHSLQLLNIRASRLFVNSDLLKQERNSIFRAISLGRSKKGFDLSMSTVSKASHIATFGSHYSPSSLIKKEASVMNTEQEPTAVKINCLIAFLTNILKHKYFDWFMYLITLLSMIITTQDTPLINPESILIKNMNILEKIISLIFFLEFVLKVWVFGLIKNRGSYFQQSLLNYVDFFNVIISFLLLIGVQTPHRNLQTLRSIRAFRIIKLIIFSNKDLNIIGDCMINSSVYVLKLLFFYGIFVFTFSLFAMKSLKGSLYHCQNLDSHFAEEEVKTKIDCFDFGGDWINNDTPYDNIFIAFFTLFQVSSSEGWSFIMMDAEQTVGIELAPKIGNNGKIRVFFLIYFFLAKILLLNMFIGIIIENIMLMKNQAKHIHDKNNEQKEWTLIKQNIKKMQPKRKPFRLFFYFCIIANSLVLTLFWHRQTEDWQKTVHQINLYFIYIFTVHLILRVLKFGPNYFRKWFNLYEICIMGVSYANIFLEISSKDIPFKFINQDFTFYRVFNAIAKGLQFSKLVFVFKKFQSLKQLSQTLKNIFPIFIGLLLFIVVILYMFTILAINEYCFLRPQSIVNGIDVHFRTFSYALYSLVRIATSELWFKVASDCVRQMNPTFTCQEIKDFYDFSQKGFDGCGKSSAYAFFFFFHLLFSIIIFNIFIAFIISAYDNEAKALKSAVSRYQLFDIKDKWYEYDNEGLGYISYKDFWRFSEETGAIFGLPPEDLKDLRSMKNFMKILKIPIYLNIKENLFCFKFHDVIIELSKFAMALKFGVINLDENEMEELQEKYENKSKKNNEKFSKTEFLSGDIFSILVFQRKMRYLILKKRRHNKKTRENVKEEVESNILSPQFYFETNRSLLDTEKE